MQVLHPRIGFCFVFGLLLLLTACANPMVAIPTTIDEQPQMTSTPLPVDDSLVYIPAGYFVMGSDPQFDLQAEDDELPSHSVMLPGFFIQRNEVSNSLYQQCVQAGECSLPLALNKDELTRKYNDPEYTNHPVVGVSWQQAGEFCAWMDARLPSEAEWEKTARGLVGSLYPWGNDQPTCSLSNLQGCFVNPAETNKIGQYLLGQSYYEANDMAGNVWEWTQDWYAEDYYHFSPGMSPLGPEQGDLRVVRGGSYLDGPEMLRAAERFALDPEEGYNNVGFRCVPEGLDTQAAVRTPFCQAGYVPFCVQPDNAQIDCDPQTQNTPAPSGYQFVSFGCPQNGLVRIVINAGKPANAGETVTVGGAQFECSDSEINPGQWVCWGAAPPQDTVTSVEVCTSTGNSGHPQQLVAYGQLSAAGLITFQQEPQSVLLSYTNTEAQELVAFPTGNSVESLVGFQLAQAEHCADGYVYNPNLGICQKPESAIGCPEGWAYDPASYSCIPVGGKCPAGTTYDVARHYCVPDEGTTCPAGWHYDEKNDRCQPPGNYDGGGCPAGYYFDAAVNCCAPLTGTNLDCGPGFYRSVSTNECHPLDQDGCQEGYIYNRYEGGCVPDYGQPKEAGSQCELPGYVMSASGHCYPSTELDDFQCAKDRYFNPRTQECEPLDANGCQPDQRFDPLTQACLPSDGPGSGCPIGYEFSKQQNCCSPRPGSSGDACLGREDYYGGQDNQKETGCWTYSVSVPVCVIPTPTPPVTCKSTERYNYNTQQCEKIENQSEPPTVHHCYGRPINTCTASGCFWNGTSCQP